MTCHNPRFARGWMTDEACTMAELPESLSVFDSESDAEDSEEESQSECFVELNTFDPSQATLIQVITDCKEEAIVKTSSRGPAVLELLESLQSYIERRECKELSDKLSKSMLECVSGPCGKKKIALSQCGEIFMSTDCHRPSDLDGSLV